MRAPTEIDDKAQGGLALFIRHSKEVRELKGGLDCTKVVLSVTENCWLVYTLGVRGLPAKIIPASKHCETKDRSAESR